MSQTKIKFTKLQFESNKCKLYNGNKELLKEPKRVYEILEKKCSSYTDLIVVLSIFVIFFVLILLCGLVYRHRWTLRFMYYMTKNKYQNSSRKKCDDEEYEYDTFISYEEEDAVFVHNHLLSNLEEDAKLKLCIHKRDFQPGKDIAANITSGIHNSRNVVAVLSQTYLDSYWCMFEYNMARMESIYSRNCENMFILVSLVDLSAINLPLCVIEKVHKQSYIEYPNDPLGNILFWHKLKEVLK
ncbi:toll-like receptor 4 [Mytilus californianus]|uniref:toll-like receptor 4 n=1 Tax=Mytilus californianus TaxID=6549 RepID=UPI00224717C4|nr:toll-like receptor 4 [Mytilus californianus]